MPWLLSYMASFLPGPVVWVMNPGRKLTPHDLEPRLASALVLKWVINPFSPVNWGTGCSFCPSLAGWGERLPALLGAFEGLSLALPAGTNEPGQILGDPNSPTGQNLKTRECKSSNNPQLLRSPLLSLLCSRCKMHGWREQLCSPTCICCWYFGLNSHP